MVSTETLLSDGSDSPGEQGKFARYWANPTDGLLGNLSAKLHQLNFLHNNVNVTLCTLNNDEATCVQLKSIYSEVTRDILYKIPNRVKIANISPYSDINFSIGLNLNIFRNLGCRLRK